MQDEYLQTWESALQKWESSINIYKNEQAKYMEKVVEK